MVAKALRAFAVEPLGEGIVMPRVLTAFGVDAVAAPAGMYIHAVRAACDLERVHLSGQIGRRPDGSLPATIEEQSRHPACRSAREAALGGHRPASTLLFVAGLVSPEVPAEVDVVAAGPRGAD
jgi:enamine deaminase RidA (YjgF/YER057c/UK114 family)